jgi:hypothetical protein
MADLLTEDKVQLLRLEKEAAELRRSLKELSRPWWRSWNVTAITALVAAVIPVTTGVQAYFQKEKELALDLQKHQALLTLEKEKQTEQIRAGYLDRAADPRSRRLVLRWIIATQPSLQDWARKELEIVEQELAQKQQKVEQKTRELEQDIDQFSTDPKRDNLALQAKTKIWDAKLLLIVEQSKELREMLYISAPHLMEDRAPRWIAELPTDPWQQWYAALWLVRVAPAGPRVPEPGHQGGLPAHGSGGRAAPRWALAARQTRASSGRSRPRSPSVTEQGRIRS